MMTNAEFAILSLIVEGPLHGYDIERVIEERGMRNWTEVGFSSIYYLLKKLEKAGYVFGRLAPAEGRGPARKIYTATEDGIVACQAATRQALATPHRSYPPIQLGLSNLDSISLDEAIAALTEHRAAVTQRLVEVHRSRTQATLPDQVEMMFDYSDAILNAQLDWLNLAISKLEAKKRAQS